MIPNIHAVAIDDDKDHLDAIHTAAIKAKIICRPIHFPHGITEELSDELQNHQIRLVICDLHLQADGAMGGGSNVYSTVGGVLMKLGIQPWSPYVMLLWSKDASDTNQVNELRAYLEERLDPAILPCAIVPLAKTAYGIPGTPTPEQADALWKDLQGKIQGSRGVKLLFQWEAELYRAASQVTSSLVATIRGSEKPCKKIDINEEIDQLLSQIARAATSSGFAKDHPRSATVEGLLPLVTDQYQHLLLSADDEAVWRNGLQAITGPKLDPLSIEQAARLNGAMHVARDSSVARPERGAVFDCPPSELKENFGIDHADTSKLGSIFGISGKWPKNVLFKFVQMEGACDAAQRKNGVVPLMLAIEVDATQSLLEKGDGKGKRPQSVEVTPIFMGSQPKKLIVNVRYFFTLSRDELDKKQPIYRLRESLVSSLAFAWANHTIRPGIVSFTPESTEMISGITDENPNVLDTSPQNKDLWFKVKKFFNDHIK